MAKRREDLERGAVGSRREVWLGPGISVVGSRREAWGHGKKRREAPERSAVGLRENREACGEKGEGSNSRANPQVARQASELDEPHALRP